MFFIETFFYNTFYRDSTVYMVFILTETETWLPVTGVYTSKHEDVFYYKGLKSQSSHYF